MSNGLVLKQLLIRRLCLTVRTSLSWVIFVRIIHRIIIGIPLIMIPAVIHRRIKGHREWLWLVPVLHCLRMVDHGPPEVLVQTTMPQIIFFI